LMISPMIVEICLSVAGIVESSGAIRATTSLPFGFFALVGGLRWLASSPHQTGRRVSFPEPESS
jgi:hypothetical protein